MGSTVEYYDLPQVLSNIASVLGVNVHPVKRAIVASKNPSAVLDALHAE